MKTFISIALLTFAPAVLAADDADIAALFTQENVVGTMVIESKNTAVTYVYNEKRANTRFSTASTFKIPHSLIAIDEGVIDGPSSVIPWDGTKHTYASWNQDQTLATAYQRSCVWCYQAFAKQIGAEKYPAYLLKMNYGTLQESFNETTFWLDGGLTISATEQIAFLKNLYNRSFNFSDKAYDALSDIMVEEKTADYTLRAKTGWATRESPQVGWYVGMVETSNDVWFFATNLRIDSTNALPLRKKLTKLALNSKGITSQSLRL